MLSLLSKCMAELIEPTEEQIFSVIAHYGIDFPDAIDDNDLIINTIQKAMAEGQEQATKFGIISFDDQIWLPSLYDWHPPSYSWVLCDEAQDLSKGKLKLALSSLSNSGRFIAVADRHQCHPPGTMVEVTGKGKVAIENLKIGDQLVTWLWNDGNKFCGINAQGRKILDIASRPYDGELYTVTTDKYSADCTPNHKWFTRFNQIEECFLVYMMQKDSKFRIGMCNVLNIAQEFQLNQCGMQEKADKAWILKIFKSKKEAKIYEQKMSYKFGIPMLVFKEVNCGKNYRHDYFKQEEINDIFEFVDLNNSKAIECLNFNGRNILYPFWRIDAISPKKDRRNKGTRRPGYDAKNVFVTETCNLIPEFMSINIYEGNEENNWQPLNIKTKNYNGIVYSLKVDGNECYIANNLLTRNSIMGFSGADCKSVDNIIEQTKPKVLPLSVCYRCPKSVIVLAQEIVPHIEYHPNAPEGSINEITEDVFMTVVKPGAMVLCRKTNPLISLCIKLIANKIGAKVKGREIGTQIKKLVHEIMGTKSKNLEEFYPKLNAYVARKRAKIMQRPDFDVALQNFDDKIKCVEVIFEAYMPKNIFQFNESIDVLFSDENSIITLSTVHKAKGLEAPNIYIYEPQFLPLVWKNQKPWEYEQEMNLKYVAITRAQETLTFVKVPPKDK